MREVNKAYGLPDPPMWYQTLFKTTIAAMMKLATRVIRYKGEVVRVSLSIIKAINRSGLTIVRSSRRLKLRNRPYQTTAILGL